MKLEDPGLKCSVIKRRLPRQVFFREIFKVFKETYFEENCELPFR